MNFTAAGGGRCFATCRIIIFLFVTYTIIQSITSSEMCSLYLTHPSAHTPGAVDAAAPGEQLGVRRLAQGSHLRRGQFLPEPRFEPTTSGYKSNALSIRPQLHMSVYYNNIMLSESAMWLMNNTLGFELICLGLSKFVELFIILRRYIGTLPDKI